MTNNDIYIQVFLLALIVLVGAKDLYNNWSEIKNFNPMQIAFAIVPSLAAGIAFAVYTFGQTTEAYSYLASL